MSEFFFYAGVIAVGSFAADLMAAILTTGVKYYIYLRDREKRELARQQAERLFAMLDNRPSEAVGDDIDTDTPGGSGSVN